MLSEQNDYCYAPAAAAALKQCARETRKMLLCWLRAKKSLAAA
jgi:hypothetical protein